MRTQAGNVKKGEFVLYNGTPHQVTKAEFYSPGKGSALMRCRLKSVSSGKQVDYTYKSNENVEVIEVNSMEMTYLYKDGENVFVMDQNYEQHTIPLAVVGSVIEFIKDGEIIFVYMYNETPLAIRAPASVKLRVTETEGAVKGDTVTGGKKPAILETGVTIQVPLFVKVGDLLVVNPETGEYSERSS